MRADGTLLKIGSRSHVERFLLIEVTFFPWDHLFLVPLASTGGAIALGEALIKNIINFFQVFTGLLIAFTSKVRKTLDARFLFFSFPRWRISATL
jgi:hypothetical protein